MGFQEFPVGENRLGSLEIAGFASSADSAERQPVLIQVTWVSELGQRLHPTALPDNPSNQ